MMIYIFVFGCQLLCSIVASLSRLGVEDAPSTRVDRVSLRASAALRGGVSCEESKTGTVRVAGVT